MREHLQKTMNAFFANAGLEAGRVQIIAKNGYSVLDNGDIVGLDDDGNPTDEPFTGYVSDEHQKIAEVRKAAIVRRKQPPRVLKSGKWPQ